MDVTRKVFGSDGKENVVRLEDEFQDAMFKADELKWIEQVRGLHKERSQYKVSEKLRRKMRMRWITV